MPVILLLLLVSCSDDATFTSITHNVNANISGQLRTEFLSPDSKNSNNLDILLVIDDSDSMAGYRKNLSDKLAPLLSEVQDRSWQIAIATTNAQKECLEVLIDKDTPDYRDVYRQTIDKIGNSGSSNYEEAIKMVIASLRGLSICGQEDSYIFWLQPDSMLSILIITDEDHQCHKRVENEECDPSDLANYLRVAGRTPNLTSKIYGLLNHPDKSSKFLAWTDKDGESIFTSYQPLVPVDKNGKSYSDEDLKEHYHKILSQISQQLASGMQFTFNLAKRYNGEASEVVIYFDDDERILDQGEYGFIDDKLIIIGNIPANTDKIKATYSYTP